jgi:EpsI family protein
MSRLTRLAISCALLGVALLVLQFRSSGEAIPLRKSLDTFPETVGDWKVRDAASLDPEVVNLLKVNDYVLQRYVAPDGQGLWLYVAYWATQRKGGAQIHSPQNCLPGSGWEPVEASRIVIPLAAPAPPITVNRYLIQKEGSRQVVVYWYHSQGKDVAGEVQAKMAMVRNALWNNRSDGALIRISTPVQGTVPETTERLIRYVQAVYPILSQYLPD